MNRRLKNFIIRRLVLILVSWLPTSSHSFGIERTDDAALRHIQQPPLNSLARRTSLVSLDSGCCSEVILPRQYDRLISSRPDEAQDRVAVQSA
jgi:hypothetical protein